MMTRTLLALLCLFVGVALCPAQQKATVLPAVEFGEEAPYLFPLGAVTSPSFRLTTAETSVTLAVGEIAPPLSVEVSWLGEGVVWQAYRDLYDQFEVELAPGIDCLRLTPEYGEALRRPPYLGNDPAWGAFGRRGFNPRDGRFGIVFSSNDILPEKVRDYFLNRAFRLPVKSSGVSDAEVQAVREMRAVTTRQVAAGFTFAGPALRTTIPLDRFVTARKPGTAIIHIRCRLYPETSWNNYARVLEPMIRTEAAEVRITVR